MFTSGGQIELVLRAVYGGKGGGSSTTYTPPAATTLTDPVSGKSFTKVNDTTSADYSATAPSAASQLNDEITAREASEKATSDKAASDKLTSDTEAEQRFQANRLTAYDTALKDVIRKFQQQGVDNPSQYAEDIMPAIQRQYNSIQDLDPNPTAAFTSDLGSTIIGDVLSGKRTQATNALNKEFTPTYAQTALPDSITDQYKSSILDDQFTPLMAQLDTARKRGTLTSAGYQGAVDALNKKRSAADASVTSLGQGILASDRSALNDYISGAKSDVNNLSLVDQFDPNAYSGTAQGKVATDLSGFAGALRNAVGDTKFADITDLINTGGATQGTQNAGAGTAAGSAVSPTVLSEEEIANSKRGLGSTGAF